MARNNEDMQLIMDQFFCAADVFGLKINISKTTQHLDVQLERPEPSNSKLLVPKYTELLTYLIRNLTEVIKLVM